MLVRFNSPFTTLFDDLFNEAHAATLTTGGQSRLMPAADVRETEKAIELHLDLPGVKPEAIDVKLEDRQLTITAERALEQQKTEGGWVRTERSRGTFVRTFSLPDSVDAAKPEAAYKHGVLTVTLPKKAESQPRSLHIKVEA